MNTSNENPASFDSDGTPLNPDGSPMLAFETKMRKRSDGTIEKAIFIDNELLDWSVDISSLAEAAKMGQKFYRAAQKDIEKHFTDSVSEFIGRKVDASDIKHAIKTGWI